MNTQLFFDILRSVIALAAGGMIGIGYGMVQERARRRNELLQAQGKLKSGVAVMPGSGFRVTCLVLVLAAIQYVCPLLFVAGTQWWVSIGVALGYGKTLFDKIIVLRAANKRA